MIEDVFARAFGGEGSKGDVAQVPKPEAEAEKSEYTNEPTMLEKFMCYLSGRAYTGGHYWDANGECKMKGELITRQHRGR